MNMFKFEFKRLTKAMLIWTAISILLIGLFVMIFPTMKDSGMQEIVNSKMGAMPEGLLEAVNLTKDVDLTKLSDYMAYCIQYIAMAAGIYGAILGTTALIKEETEGTIEFLYSKPVKRTAIISAKLLATGLIFLIFTTLVGLLTFLISLPVLPEDIKALDYLMDLKLMFFGIALVGYVFMAIGFLISTLIKSSKSSIVIGIGIFFATYIIGIASKLQKDLQWLKYFSPVEYGEPTKLIKDGFQSNNLFLALGIITVTIIGTYVVYNKKDMKI